jgi:hypothetical protein
LCVVEAKFRPKVFQKMKLRGHAGQECIAGFRSSVGSV